jgi:hypothetical protein
VTSPRRRKAAAHAHGGRTRSAAAGAVAAAVWALQEPLDQRLFKGDYSDVAVLGKGLTGGRAWWPAGFALHLANGALFGVAYHEARRRWPVRPRTLAVGMALAEHAALYPLSYFVDRYHPRRGAPGVPPLLGNRKAFGQATWRHAVFGLVLGLAAQEHSGPRGRGGRVPPSRRHAPTLEVRRVPGRSPCSPAWRSSRPA